MPSTALALALALTAAAVGRAAPGSDPAAAPDARTASRRYVVERIRFDGLTRTRPSEIRRHLSIAEGELLDDQAVLLSRLRLLQLGWFSRVETHVERGSARGLVTLVFEFTERNTLIVTDLVIGSTGPQPAYGGLGLSQGNFLGLGLALGGAFVYGAPHRFAVRGSFFDPDLALGGLPLVFGVSGIALRGEEFACGEPECNAYRGNYGGAPRLRYDRLGGEVTFGIRPGPFERLLAGYRLERVGAELLAGSAGQPASLTPYTAPALVRTGRSWVSALTGTYDRDTRNDLFFPTQGTRLALNIVFGSEALGGDYEYSRYLLQLESDHELPHGHGLRLFGAAGAAQGDAPFFDRFYAADFAYFSIGPALGRALELNFSTDSRYDAYLALLGAEYGVPLWARGSFFHRGYVAIGGRWLYTAAQPRAGRTPASRSPFSGELALRLDTPVGSFNLSLGYTLDIFL
ncbi:MAG TPA: BamA/TamA family outer membrane protein [Anaeromyxobacteraceae bacterium]|nr:BamA/TamA family outer membrane protein [Anaeromyxobacteraceae bacterium]